MGINEHSFRSSEAASNRSGNHCHGLLPNCGSQLYLTGSMNSSINKEHESFAKSAKAVENASFFFLFSFCLSSFLYMKILIGGFYYILILVVSGIFPLLRSKQKFLAPIQKVVVFGGFFLFFIIFFSVGLVFKFVYLMHRNIMFGRGMWVVKLVVILLCLRGFGYQPIDTSFLTIAFAPKKCTKANKPDVSGGRRINSDNSCFALCLSKIFNKPIDLTTYEPMAIKDPSGRYYGFDRGSIVIITNEFLKKEAIGMAIRFYVHEMGILHLHSIIRRNEISTKRTDMDFDCPSIIFTVDKRKWMPDFDDTAGTGHVFVLPTSSLFNITESGKPLVFDNEVRPSFIKEIDAAYSKRVQMPGMPKYITPNLVENPKVEPPKTPAKPSGRLPVFEAISKKGGEQSSNQVDTPRPKEEAAGKKLDNSIPIPPPKPIITIPKIPLVPAPIQAPVKEEPDPNWSVEVKEKIKAPEPAKEPVGDATDAKYATLLEEEEKKINGTLVSRMRVGDGETGGVYVPSSTYCGWCEKKGHNTQDCRKFRAGANLEYVHHSERADMVTAIHNAWAKDLHYHQHQAYRLKKNLEFQTHNSKPAYRGYSLSRLLEIYCEMLEQWCPGCEMKDQLTTPVSESGLDTIKEMAKVDRAKRVEATLLLAKQMAHLQAITTLYTGKVVPRMQRMLESYHLTKATIYHFTTTPHSSAECHDRIHEVKADPTFCYMGCKTAQSKCGFVDSISVVYEPLSFGSLMDRTQNPIQFRLRQLEQILLPKLDRLVIERSRGVPVSEIVVDQKPVETLRSVVENCNLLDLRNHLVKDYSTDNTTLSQFFPDIQPTRSANERSEEFSTGERPSYQFHTSIPSLTTREAFVSREEQVAIYLYGKMLPPIFSRLAGPLLRNLKAPNSQQPPLPSIVINLAGNACNVQVSSYPFVRSAIYRGKRVLVGESVGLQPFSQICSNYSIVGILSSRLSKIQKFTYLSMRYLVPHWILDDGLLCNRHEFNLRWSFPKMTPYLSTSIGFCSIIIFTIICNLSRSTWEMVKANSRMACRNVVGAKDQLQNLIYKAPNIPYQDLNLTVDSLGQKKIIGILYRAATFNIRLQRRFNLGRSQKEEGIHGLTNRLVRKIGYEFEAKVPYLSKFFYRNIIRVSAIKPWQAFMDGVVTGNINPIGEPRIRNSTALRLRYRLGLPLTLGEKFTLIGGNVLDNLKPAYDIWVDTAKKVYAQVTVRVHYIGSTKVMENINHNRMMYSILSVLLFTSITLAMLKRHGSYFFPSRSATHTLFYGTGPTNPSTAHLMAGNGSRRVLIAVPRPLPPLLANGKVVPRVNVMGVVQHGLPYDLFDSCHSITNILSETSTYYWETVGHAMDPITGNPVHIVEATRTEGEVLVNPLTDVQVCLNLKGLPIPNVVIVPAALPPNNPEQYFNFTYYDGVVVKVVSVKTYDYNLKMAQFISMANTLYNSTMTPEDREIRIINFSNVNASQIVDADQSEGVPVVAAHLRAEFERNVMGMAKADVTKFSHDLFHRARVGLISRKLGLSEYSTTTEHSNLYTIAFAPSGVKTYKQLFTEMDDYPVQRRKGKNSRKKKPKGEVTSEEERAGVSFTCRSCGGYPPKKFRWYFQMCPSCYTDMKSNANQKDCYYNPEISAPYPEGVHPLGPPTQILPVQPKYKNKPTIPEFQTDFRFGPLKGLEELPLDSTKGPQAVGVVTNIRSTCFNPLAAGKTRDGKGEPALLRNRIFKAPTYVATPLQWDNARRDLYNENSFLMRRLKIWQSENERIVPYLFADCNDVEAAVANGWVTRIQAQEVVTYLEEFDNYHSEGGLPNQLDHGRGWIHSFEPAVQRDIWESAVALVEYGVVKKDHKVSLFMKTEKAKNCADWGPRPAANPRCIQSFSKVTQILAGRYTRSATTMLHEMFSPDQNFSYAGGMSPTMLDEWILPSVDSQTGLIIGDKVIAMSDYSAFDTTQRKPVLDFWHEFLSHVGVPIFSSRLPLLNSQVDLRFPRSTNLLGWIFKAWSRPVGRTTRKNKYKGPYMNCSGRGDTAAMNFYLNFCTQYLAYLYALTGHFGPYSAAEYEYVNENLKFVALGDDSLVFVPRLNMMGQEWTFADLQLAVSNFGFEFSEGKITKDPRDIIFLGMRPWPAKNERGQQVLAWAPVLGRYLQKMGWRLKPEGDPYAWWKGITRAASACFPHLQIVNDICSRTEVILSHHTQTPVWTSEMRSDSYKLYYVQREEKLFPDDDRAIGYLMHIYGIDHRELLEIRRMVGEIKTFPVVLSNLFLDNAMMLEGS